MPEPFKALGMTFPITIRAQGPVLIFGGPYSNLEATQALLAEASARGIPPDHIVCTGDVVAYGADATATAELVRRSVPNVVMGNCEESLALGLSDCGCGFPVGSSCERLSSAWFDYAATQLNSDLRNWMGRLPQRIDIELGPYRLATIHGSVSTINRFIFASSAASTKAHEIELADADGVIAGHCGLPFSQNIGGRLWHNAGAIGMPANDGTPRVWFSVLSAADGGIRIEHCALDYGFAIPAQKMRDAGLPEGYTDALVHGLWPNCDVLPLNEIRARGSRLIAESIFWQPSPPKQRSIRRCINVGSDQLWPTDTLDSTPRLRPEKFNNSVRTATGEARAVVALRRLQTIWFNTGTLCNITCRNCYIESSPQNDRLDYLRHSDFVRYLDEIDRDKLGTEEIGFTGGEPFMNPDLTAMLEECLPRGYRVLVLTNAMRPMQHAKARLVELNDRFRGKLIVRVSLDHFNPDRHDDERGPDTFQVSLAGLLWLAQSGIRVTVAGRTMWGDDVATVRHGYSQLFAAHRIPIDASDPNELILFPEIDPSADVPEITESCWDILGKSPDDIMCATSRMVVKRKGAERPTVLACTLIPYDPEFELGETLSGSLRSVSLNHPNCARFCVLGGASCSPKATARVKADI